MRNKSTVAVIIPAFNEEPSIGKVLDAIPEWVDDVVVVDNGSTDRTAEIARERGARIVVEPRRGYGSACLAGIAALEGPGIIVFLDGDFSDHPDEMPLLVDPIASGRADIVIGSRTIGKREPGALTPQALFGNWLSCMLIRWFWSVSYSDLGPFRAIRYETLKELAMRDVDYGWTVEMQIKAAQSGARSLEVPVSYRKRIGKSKISGTVRGVIGAGTKILSTIFRAAAGSLPGDDTTEPRERLIVFTRYPKPGRTKTRLIRALGPDGAAELHRRMTERAVSRAKELAKRRHVCVEIRYDGGSKRLMSGWLGPGLDYRKQGKGVPGRAGGPGRAGVSRKAGDLHRAGYVGAAGRLGAADDLGDRMHEAFAEAFQDGAERVVLAGTDCPGVSADIFEKAFKALDRNDLVLGPASDGGYYLIAMKRPLPSLFAGIPWSTKDVLSQTMQAADKLGLRLSLVDLLNDVDRPEDLPVWERESGRPAADTASISISVIIPTYNEADNVAEAVASARATDVEVIVVDGGSDDGTVEAAEAAGARATVSRKGRGSQMNAGAAEATGDLLLFLHADTRLPDDYAGHVRETAARAGVVAGAFRLGVDSPKKSLRLIETLANWRSRRMRMPYGDQALFMRAELFREMGGFPEIPLMEDFEFVRRLKRRGPIEIVPASVRTSSRQWLALGTLRMTFINQAAIAAYFLGVPISKIADWHHAKKERAADAPTVAESQER